MQIVTWLILFGVGALLLAVYLKYRPKVEGFNEETQEETLVIETPSEEDVAVIDVPSEPRASIDFGFKQGFKFAFGFWIGTFCLGFLCFFIFGGIISTFLHNSLQSALISR